MKLYLNLVVILCLIFLGANCTHTVSTKNLSPQIEIKQADCQIAVYSKTATVAENSHFLGEINVGNQRFTTDYGFDAALAVAKKEGCKLGADAIKIVQRGGFSDTDYTIKAKAISFDKSNRTVSIKSKEEIILYLDSEDNLNPIEGIWTSADNRYQIGIIKEASSGGMGFVGVILRSENKRWDLGEVKLELEESAFNNTFNANYYMDDYSKQGIPAMITNGALIEMYVINPNDKESQKITYIKNYPPVP